MTKDSLKEAKNTVPSIKKTHTLKEEKLNEVCSVFKAMSLESVKSAKDARKWVGTGLTTELLQTAQEKLIAALSALLIVNSSDPL